jgi:alcohol dehydrogenase class IV
MARFVHETLPQRVVFASLQAAEHVTGDVAERARKAAEERDADVLVSVGGGSAMAALGAASALEGLQRLRKQVGAPRAPRDYGLRQTDIPTAVDAGPAAVPPANPVPVTAAGLEELLRRARDGREPR